MEIIDIVSVSWDGQDFTAETGVMTAVRQSPNQPWLILPRASWAQLAQASNISLDDATLNKLRGLQDPTNLDDVKEVYLPLTQLIELYRANTTRMFAESNNFLDISATSTPFVIGVAGSVAVGKSTTARLLAELLRRQPSKPKVDLITTDGFLLPNDELIHRGILDRKGFPESYDRRSMLEFVIAVKSGKPRVSAPKYSHLIYDIIPDEEIIIEQPDILIVEGLNVLQPATIKHNGQSITISDFFDFSVYVNAEESNIRNWYLSRFLALRNGAFADPKSYFHKYSLLSDSEARETALAIWETTNGPNLRANIEPTKDRATVVLRKSEDHTIRHVRIRKI